MKRQLRVMSLAAATLTLVLGLSLTASAQEHKDHAAHAAAAAPAMTKAVCVLTPTKGNKASGKVTFTQQADGVLVEATVSGLEPGSKHGFHIHEFGDLSSEDGTSLGGHFNPAGAPHGAPDAKERHAGDLGNIEADAQGNATLKLLDKHLEIHGKDSILSRGVVVHAAPDDFGQPTGNAGARIAVGTIGIAKP
jgi:Cu-Zn family superoxide dismutase